MALAVRYLARASALGLLVLILSGNTAIGADAVVRQGADLLKADLMGVFAHPDDETGVAATLATYALGRTSVVANIYCTRGEGGGNMVGTQSGAALGILREGELRECLEVLGVKYCYFLDCLDWAYTESAAATLDKWNKEQTLERLVRLIRSLRPDVLVTMNPAPNPGQHGHHQAAGILATEAFAAAADPKRFALQLSKEGLNPWQVRKLYYSGGSTGIITTIDVTKVIREKETAAKIAGRALSNHRSQAFGNFGDSPWLQRPQKFTLGKSFVPNGETGHDLLDGVATSPLLAVEFPQAQEAQVRIRFIPRPAVARYRTWAEQQGIAHVAAQFRADLPVVAAEPNLIVLQVVNHGPRAFSGVLKLALPEGWRADQVSIATQVAASSSQEIRLHVVPPAQADADVELTAALDGSDGPIVASATLHPVPRAAVIRLSQGLTMDQTDAGWDRVPELHIGATQTWQGKVANDDDNSARFRIAHDGKTLFVDVHVQDDIVVSNIATNDIKGHWRSDSIEICVDPTPGSEHTMGCYKLGIFPFDTTGTVRAARDADANQGPAEETAPRTRLTSWRVPGGYHVRAAIPMGELGVEVASTKRLGFNLLIYDGDKRDALPGENINKSRLAWAPRSGVMGRPEDWGRIDLE